MYVKKIKMIEQQPFWTLRLLIFLQFFQSVLRKVTPEDAPKISDQVMSALLRMLSSSAQVKTGGVQEDVLLAISTLVEGRNWNVIQY